MNRPLFLTEHRSSEHFDLYYGLRNAPLTSGTGIHGVRDLTLIDHYFSALEQTFAFLTGQPLKLDPPARKIAVYVLDLGVQFQSGASPFTFQDIHGDPYIALPNRTDAPTKEEEYRHAIATACHEAFHAAVWHLHSRRDIGARSWVWLDEGCAVWTEMQVRPDIEDYLRFGLNWCDRSDVSIDHDSALYECGFFVAYLVRRFGAEIVAALWRSGNGSRTAWDALRTHCGAAWESLIPEYCRDAFFVADDASPLHLPKLAARYHGRAVRDVLDLHRATPTRLKGQLNHLACHYYLIQAEREPVVRPIEGAPGVHFDLVGISGDGKMVPPGSGKSWVVIASNPGISSRDDGRLYQIEIGVA